MHFVCTILSLYFLVTFEFILKCFIPSFNLYADAWHSCYAGQSITHGPFFFKIRPTEASTGKGYSGTAYLVTAFEKNLETNILFVLL